MMSHLAILSVFMALSSPALAPSSPAAIPASPALVAISPIQISQQQATPESATGALLGTVLHSSDIARSLSFYVDGLGMKLKMTMGAAARREYMLGFSNDPRATGLILLYDEVSKTHPPITISNGFDRLVLRMADLDATSARLIAKGYKPSKIRDVAMGYRMMVVTDPEGYKLEMVQSAPRK